MKLAALLRLTLVLVVAGAADLAGAKTDQAPGGPAPVLYKREARFSRLYKPALKPEKEAVPVRLAPLGYPKKWVQWGQPAYADMAFLVDETGRPIEIQCTEATDRAFAKEAIKALEFSRFRPALKNQQGVCSKVVHRIEFVLPSATPAPAVPAAAGEAGAAAASAPPAQP